MESLDCTWSVSIDFQTHSFGSVPYASASDGMVVDLVIFVYGAHSLLGIILEGEALNGLIFQSKKGGKDQKSIQSTGYHMGN